MKRLSKEVVDFVKQNKGKYSQVDLARKLNISPSSVSVIISGRTYYNPETKKRYFAKNRDKIRAWSKKYRLDNYGTITAKARKDYEDKRILRDKRNWEQRLSDGIEMFQFIMRRFYAKHQRLESYRRVILEMKEQRMTIAA